MSNLYEVVEELKAIQEKLGTGEEITDADLQQLREAEWTLDRKVGAIMRVMRDLRANAVACTAEVARLQTRSMHWENDYERLKGWLGMGLLLADVKAVKLADGSARIQQGMETAIIDNDKLPDEVVVNGVTVKLRREPPPPPARNPPDKAAIIALLKDKVEIPGAKLERGAPFVVVK